MFTATVQGRQPPGAGEAGRAQDHAASEPGRVGGAARGIRGLAGSVSAAFKGQAAAFDVKTLPEGQRVAFYGCLFALAAADRDIEKDEVAATFETLDTAGMSESARRRIHSFLLSPPPFEENLAVIAGGRSAELRYGLMLAMMEVALSDGDLTAEEKGLLQRAASRLSVTQDQLTAIEKFVREVQRIRNRGIADNYAFEALKSAMAGLGGVGVPLAAVYFSGAVIGFSAAGITSGLAALGLGFGMVPGIGVAIALGAGIFIGTRWFLGRGNRRAKAQFQAERERRAQLAIRNLHDAINAIIARLGQLQAAAGKAQANQKAIRALTERLNALKQLLSKRKAEATA
jgi:uncharacterized tellurite resistance protein B-like protein